MELPAGFGELLAQLLRNQNVAAHGVAPAGYTGYSGSSYGPGGAPGAVIGPGYGSGGSNPMAGMSDMLGSMMQMQMGMFMFKAQMNMMQGMMGGLSSGDMFGGGGGANLGSVLGYSYANTLKAALDDITLDDTTSATLAVGTQAILDATDAYATNQKTAQLLELLGQGGGGGNNGLLLALVLGGGI